MAPVHVIKFSYLGVNRFVICDLNTPYDTMQKLVSQTFKLPQECTADIQFTDGKGYTFTKDIFEYFLILFPEPEQKFYIRFECSKIMAYRTARNGKIFLPVVLKKDIRKRTHDTMQGAHKNIVYAAPLRRQNCFLGKIPSKNGAEMTCTDVPPPKRMRLLTCVNQIKRASNQSQVKRVLML